MQKANEIWECTTVSRTTVMFDVLNENTGERRLETMTRNEFSTFMEAGGYPAIMAGTLLLGEKTGWRFRKIQNGNIYVDGPSTSGNPDDPYHPIDK